MSNTFRTRNGDVMIKDICFITLVGEDTARVGEFSYNMKLVYCTDWFPSLIFETKKEAQENRDELMGRLNQTDYISDLAI